MRVMGDSMVSLCMSPMVPLNVSTMAAWTATDTCSCLSISHVYSFSRLPLGSAASLRRLHSCVPGAGRASRHWGKWQLSAPGIKYDKCMSAASPTMGRAANPSPKWTLKGVDLAAPETESFLLDGVAHRRPQYTQFAGGSQNDKRRKQTRVGLLV